MSQTQFDSLKLQYHNILNEISLDQTIKDILMSKVQEFENLNISNLKQFFFDLNEAKLEYYGITDKIQSESIRSTIKKILLPISYIEAVEYILKMQSVKNQLLQSEQGSVLIWTKASIGRQMGQLLLKIDDKSQVYYKPNQEELKKLQTLSGNHATITKLGHNKFKMQNHSKNGICLKLQQRVKITAGQLRLEYMDHALNEDISYLQFTFFQDDLTHLLIQNHIRNLSLELYATNPQKNCVSITRNNDDSGTYKYDYGMKTDNAHLYVYYDDENKSFIIQSLNMSVMTLWNIVHDTILIDEYGKDYVCKLGEIEFSYSLQPIPI